MRIHLQQRAVAEGGQVMRNQSIYEKLLGSEFQKLHPKLQKRYQVREGDRLIANGTMHRIKGGPKWLYPLWLLGTKFKLVFPEGGFDIPFTIKNTAYKTKEGIEEVYWERSFYFPNKTRYFNATMSLDAKRHIIKDYLGDPSPLYSDLKFTIETDGSITIESVKQRLIIGKLEIPLPKMMYGVATVKESYDENIEAYTIYVHVRNRIIGTVFKYKGVFNLNE